MKSIGAFWLGCLGLIFIAGCRGETPEGSAPDETTATPIETVENLENANSPDGSLPA